jgi:nucleoside phosphorylase
MTTRHYSSKKQDSGKFYPDIPDLPPLPAIKWDEIDNQPPKLLDTPAGKMPAADIVVITWAGAEWAALEHVFVQSDKEMPYSDASKGEWDGWQKYDLNMPYYPSSGNWDYWGYYRLVEINAKKVLLFKSNTHLDWPGERFLEELIQRFTEYVKPELILSIGTAGGCRLSDNLGAVNVVNGATMYDQGKPKSEWKRYYNDYSPAWSIIDGKHFDSLLFTIQATDDNLQKLADEFNEHCGPDYSLCELNGDGLDNPTKGPVLSNLTPEKTPLLTASTFVVGTTSGEFKEFAVIEMDDAVIAKVCHEEKVAFGFVRNISDPAQNAKLPPKVQGNWGSSVYDVFGFYTSYNGALVTWAMIAALHR